MGFPATSSNNLISEEKALKHITIPISVPISCAAIDDKNNSLNLRMSVATKVSASGIALEVYREIDSDLVLLSFVDVNDRSLELKGKVVSSTKIESGAFNVEISFHGSKDENIEFAKHLVIINRRSGQKPETIIDRRLN
jgi:hypothetical protein